MNPVQKAAQDWESKAIEACRNDPKVAALGLCYVCMVKRPCICEQKQIVEIYEADRRENPMNLYSNEERPLMINSGEFWRCPHGSTGYYACWRCGLRHPFRFIKHLFECRELL